MDDLICVKQNDTCRQARSQLRAILRDVIRCDNVIYAHGINAHVTSEAFTFLRNIKTDDRLVNVYLNIVKESCYKSEHHVGFGTKFICMLIDDLFDHTHEKSLSCMHNVYRNLLQTFNDAIINDGVIPNRQKFEVAVEDVVNDLNTQNSILCALNKAGLNGSVHISDDVAINDSIHAVDGYTFNIISHFHRFNEQSIQLHNCKSLLVDGIIEQVSEIHNLLERFSKEKEPLIIFALGFGGEVLQTLETNYKRGTLRVYPVQIPSEIDNINMLNDIQVVTGTRFISSLQGEIIQMADYDSLIPVDYLSLSKNKITIKNVATAHNVDVHATELRHRAMNADVNDLNQLLLKRIRALTAQYVNVRLAARSQQEHLQKREKMSQVLRYATSIINSGVYENAYNVDNSGFLNTLNRLPHRYLSINALLFAAQMAITTFELLNSIDAACMLA